MTMSKLDVATNPARTREDRRRINDAWVMLHDARDAELLSANQMLWILEREPPMIDDDNCPGLVVQLWRIMLERAARDPRGVGANVDALRTFSCSGGCSDTGMVECEDDADGNRWAKPCKVCRPIPYTRWLDHWRDPDHSCVECSGPTGRRKTLADESRDAREDRDDDVLDGLR